jgi:tetratricopeptide (TPR) repeat protein
MGTPTIGQLLERNWQELAGTPFENFLAQVFDALGYSVVKTGAQTRRTQGDHGVDLLISSGRDRFAIQTKGQPSGSRVRVDAVRDVCSAVKYYKWKAGLDFKASLVVTNSTFNRFAVDEAKSQACRLVDRRRMPDLIQGKVLPLYPSQKHLSPAEVLGTTLSPEERFRQGRQLVEEGDLAEGYALIKELCRTHPLFQAPLLFCAEKYLELGLFPNALKLYQKAIPLGGCDRILYARAAHSACEIRNFAEARRLLDLAEEHVRKSNFTPEMWITYARVAAQQAQSQEALQYLRNAIKAATDSVQYEKDPLLVPLYEKDRLLGPLFRERGFTRLMAQLRSRMGHSTDHSSMAPLSPGL